MQALRAVAALSVAVLHLLNEASRFDPRGAMTWLHDAVPWGAGVDLFFVISGFVMVHASTGLFGRRDAPAVFMTRRLIRIVPLYWAATTAFLLVAFVRPGSVSTGADSVLAVAMSYAFLPMQRADGTIQPIYSLGWTLNYEMLFYLVFAACLWQPIRRALVSVTLSLGGAIALHSVVPAGATMLVFWTNPIIAEFLFGMAIATAAATGVLLPGWLRVALAVTAVGWLIAQHQYGIGGPQPLVIGVPMALLVVAAVLGRAIPVPTALLLLGDASYALYLVHPFPMRAAALLWQRLQLSGPLAAAAYTVVALLLAVATAIAVHLWFERPVGAWLRGRLTGGMRRPPLPRAVM